MKKIFYSLFALAISALTLQSCEDVPAPYDIPGSGEKPSVVEPAGTGTEADPYNIAGILKATESLASGENLPEKVYFKGVVTSVKECSPSYGNATFYLGDDIESTKTFYVYQCLGVGNKNITSEDEVQVGDTITIYGTITNYNGTIETAKKDAYIYKSSRGGASGPVVEAIEITCAKAIELCNALEDGASSTETYSITGYITDVYSTISYGQQSFWISDNNDGQKMVQAYWANLPSGVGAFTKGSKVKITGNLLKYVNASQVVIPEVKNADVEILEQGGSSGGSTGDAKHITISEFLSKKDTETTYELSGVVKNIANTTYGNFDLVEGDAKIYIYGLLDKDGNAKNFASLGISEGDEVTLTGVYSEFNGSPQIKNAQFVSVKKGSGGGTGGGEDVPPTGDNLLGNGGFETWNGDQPANWKTTSTAGNATLSKSTDAHGGSYSVSIGYTTSANKRMGYKETELEAGTYVFTFYAKATTGGKCQTRPGYVPVKDGSVGSYSYGDYADLSNTEWKQVTYEFELKEKSTVCLVIMNPKSSGYHESQNILVDDAKLMKK